MSFFTPREKRRLRDIEGFTKQKLTLGKLPTQEDIFKHREEQVLEQMKVWLARGRAKRERAIVEQLAAEGHDLLDIAAAALKLSRAGEKQRPVAEVAEVVETRYEPRERDIQPRPLPGPRATGSSSRDSLPAESRTRQA